MFDHQHLAKPRSRLSLSEIYNEQVTSFFNIKKIPRRKRNSSIVDRQIASNYHSPSPQKCIPLSFSKPSRPSKSSKIEHMKQNCCMNENASLMSVRVSFQEYPPKRRRGKSKLWGEEIQENISPSNQLKLVQQQIGKLLQQKLSTIPKKWTKDNFQFVQKLGEGSFSTVYKVVQKESQSIFAMKMIDKQSLLQQQIQRRLKQQIKIQLFLNHPAIIKLYGYFSDQNYVYLLQQFVGGQTLYSYMKTVNKQGGLSDGQVSVIISQICQAVKHLHLNNVIHRDIKPENILVFGEGVIKLTDFGWSIHNPSHELRQTLCGTPLYLSPQLLSNTFYDESVDIWAIGVLAYQLLTGDLPFGIRKMQDLGKIITNQVDLENIKNEMAKNLIMSLLMKDVKKRKNIQQICRHPFLQLEVQPK